jgi:hypothetical protein
MIHARTQTTPPRAAITPATSTRRPQHVSKVHHERRRMGTRSGLRGVAGAAHPCEVTRPPAARLRTHGAQRCCGALGRQPRANFLATRVPRHLHRAVGNARHGRQSGPRMKRAHFTVVCAKPLQPVAYSRSQLSLVTPMADAHTRTVVWCLVQSDAVDSESKRLLVDAGAKVSDLASAASQS